MLKYAIEPAVEADLQVRLSHGAGTRHEAGNRQLTWVVGIQVALLLGVVGAMVGAYFR